MKLKHNRYYRARVEELEAEAAKGTFHAGNFSLLQQRDRLRMERDELRARIEELEDKIHNDDVEFLKDHIQELGDDLTVTDKLYREAKQERDELRTRLAESERLRDLQFEVYDKHSDLLEASLAEANEKLAALQPKENAMTHYIVTKEFLDACTAPMDMWEDDRGPWELSDEEYQAAVTVNERDRSEPTIVKQTWQAIYNDERDNYGKRRYTRELCLANAVKDNTLIALMRLDHYSDGTVRCVLEPVGDGK